MARPRGANLSEAERVLYGDRALALKLQGLTYEEITREVPVHKNSLGRLIRDAARRRTRDRDITEEINRGIAIQRQLVEDMLRDFRSLGSGTPHRATARAKLAAQIVKAQMNLLFLSGVEVPDPERVILDKLAEMEVPMLEPTDYLSQPEVRETPELTANPRASGDDPGGDPDDQGGFMSVTWEDMPG